MPTNRKRVMRHRGLSGTGSIPENDLEFLCNGSVMFCGETHSFKSLKDARKFYFRNKKWIFHLQGQQIRGANAGCFYFSFGSRPWCYWKFEIEDDSLYYKFLRNPEAEFRYLRNNGLLIDGEAERYRQHQEALEKESADIMARSRDTRIVIDNTKSID